MSGHSFPLKTNLSTVLTPATAAPEIARTDLISNTKTILKRAKLWELNDKYHCPVIGTCLPTEELVKFSRRFFCLVDPRDDFAMHVSVVSYANNRNETSEALQKYLERKYHSQIAHFEQAKSDQEVWATWQEQYAQGEIAGALWAAITHKAVSATTQDRIFSDIHMLSHQIGAGQAAHARQLSKLKKDNATVSAALEKQKKHQAKNEEDLRLQLSKAVTERDRLRSNKNEVERLQARLLTYESGSAMIDMGRKLLNLQAANDQMIAIGQHNFSLEKTLKAARDETQVLVRERAQLIAERNALERLLLAGGIGDIGDGLDSDCDGQCKSCDKIGLGRCVLYVGGRNSLLAQYRALAERLGVRLIHHDGGREESLSRLPDLINGADAVMCPTDCVSHSAYYQLKRQCKRSGKPCLLFKGAGISGFAVALARLSAGQTSVAGSSAAFA